MNNKHFLQLAIKNFTKMFSKYFDINGLMQEKCLLGKLKELRSQPHSSVYKARKIFQWPILRLKPRSPS